MHPTKLKNKIARTETLAIIDKKICRNSELNQGHRDFQSLALPTELLRHILCNFHWVGRASSTFSLYVSPHGSTGGAIAAYPLNFLQVIEQALHFIFLIVPAEY